MKLLLKSQLRFVAHARWSAATALLGLILGVASVVAVHLIGARVMQSLDATSPPHLAGLTHVLTRPGMDAEDYFTLRGRWRQKPDSPVEALVPIVEGYAATAQGRVRVLGADWLTLPSVASASRRQPLVVSDDVLVGEAVVADASLNLAVGDTVMIGGHGFRIATVRDTGLGAAIVADIAAAQAMLGAGPEAVSRVGLALRDPWRPWRQWVDRLMPGFAAGLPAPASGELSVLAPGLAAGGDDWRAVPVAAQRPSAQFARAVLFDLGALGTLALLVAWFLIYQVGVIWLRRQHLLLERLHAVGVSRGMLRRSFVTVFALMGALASLVGAGVGGVLASALTGLATRGIEGAVSQPPGLSGIDVWVAAKAIVSGLGVCLVGGLGAFSREWPRRPADARRRLRWWAWAAPLAAVAAAGIVVDRSGVLGGFVAILAMSVGGVWLVWPLLALLRGMTVGRHRSILTRLALRDVAWHPSMLAVALAALSLAVATSIGVGLMVESFRSDFGRMLELRLAGDLYLDTAEASPERLQAWLEGQPDVRAVTWSGRDRLRVGGVPVALGYGRFDAAESGRYGFPGSLAPGQALVSERLARDLNVASGDRLALARGTLVVVGVFPDFGNPMGRLLVDSASLARLGVAPRIDRLTVTLTPGMTVGTSLVERLAARFPAVTVESRSEIRATALRVFDRTFAITQALTLLALVVAVVGTYNALTALRLHQAPTAALLRAEGVSRREIRRIAVIRAGTMGSIAVVLALPLGLAMAWTLCAVINPRSFGWTVNLHLPVAGWLPPLLLGLLAAVLAGTLPAPRERGALHGGT